MKTFMSLSMIQNDFFRCPKIQGFVPMHYFFVYPPLQLSQTFGPRIYYNRKYTILLKACRIICKLDLRWSFVTELMNDCLVKAANKNEKTTTFSTKKML